MKHYSLEQWVDFIRNLTAEPVRTQMQVHLDSQCGDCLQAVSRLQMSSSALGEVDVPESVFARARAIFPPRPSPSARVPRLIAALSFDSYNSAVPLGIRAMARPSIRRLAYSVEDVVIELLVDSVPEKGTIVITGQISGAHGNTAGPGRTVWLASTSKTVHPAEVNPLGEFQVEFVFRPGLRLLILDGEAGREIEVPLNLLGRARRSIRKSST